MSRYTTPPRGTVSHHRNMAALLLREADIRSVQNSEIRTALLAVRRHRLAAEAKGFRLPA
jgi:hypothetical protein